MRPSNSLVINAASAAANKNSVPLWADNIVRVSFQVVASNSSAAGTIQVQVSDDQSVGLPANQFIPTNWANLGSPVTLTGSSSLNALVPAIEVAYEYIRIVYTDTTGATATGTISARAKAIALG